MNTATKGCAVKDNDGDDRWISIHNRFLLDTLDKDPEVIFIGDSILQFLGHTDVWNQWFAPLHSLNFSIHKDQTQNVLWRIANGELDNVRPKVVVLHVGTDNIENSASEIAESILEIVRLIREKHPNVYIILPTLLPRGQYPNILRDKNSKVNLLVKDMVSHIPRVEIVAIDNGFVQPDGCISHHDMHDYLLLTNAGCRKAFEPVHELLTQILSEDEPEKDLTPSE